MPFALQNINIFCFLTYMSYLHFLVSVNLNYKMLYYYRRLEMKGMVNMALDYTVIGQRIKQACRKSP